MDGLVRTADSVLREDRLSASLQELHGSILALSKKIQTLAASDEIDRLITSQTGFRDTKTAQLVTNEDRLEALKDIYKRFLILQDSLVKRQEDRTANSINVLADQSTDGHYTDQMTRRLSLASRLSQDSADLRQKMNIFVGALKQFEDKMKLEAINMETRAGHSIDGSVDNWTKGSTSHRSSLSMAQSTFEVNHSTYEEQKKKMESFIGALDSFKLKLAIDDEVLKSESQSAFSDSMQSSRSSKRFTNAPKEPPVMNAVTLTVKVDQRSEPATVDQSPMTPHVVFSKTQVVIPHQKNPGSQPIQIADQFAQSPQLPKQRMSIIDRIKQELQHGSSLKDSQQDSLLGSQTIVFTPEKKAPDADRSLSDARVDTPPRSVSSLFESLSERTFNAAEKLNLGQIWNNIMTKADVLAVTLNQAYGPDLLRSEQHSEFTSVASVSLRNSVGSYPEKENAEILPEDMSTKFDFKK